MVGGVVHDRVSAASANSAWRCFFSRTASIIRRSASRSWSRAEANDPCLSLLGRAGISRTETNGFFASSSSRSAHRTGSLSFLYLPFVFSSDFCDPVVAVYATPGSSASGGASRSRGSTTTRLATDGSFRLRSSSSAFFRSLRVRMSSTDMTASFRRWFRAACLIRSTLACSARSREDASSSS